MSTYTADLVECRDHEFRVIAQPTYGFDLVLDTLDVTSRAEQLPQPTPRRIKLLLDAILQPDVYGRLLLLQLLPERGEFEQVIR